MPKAAGGGAELPKAASEAEPKDNVGGKKEESKPGRGSQFRSFASVVRTMLTRNAAATSQLGNAASTAEGTISKPLAEPLRRKDIIRSNTM